MGSSKHKKRQSRLAFTPLPPSSPASSLYNKQIRDRAATVSIEGSPRPAKRRKVTDASAGEHVSVSHVLPTPDATAASNTEPISDEDHSEPANQRLSSRKSQKKQKKLHFDSSPVQPSSKSSSLNMGPPLKLRSTPNPTPKAGFFGTQKTAVHDSSDDDEDVGKPASSVDTEDDVELPLPSLSESRSKRKQAHGGESSNEDDAEDDVESNEDGDEDDDEVLPTTPAARRRAKHTKQPQPETTPERASSPLIQVDDDDDDSDDVVVLSSRTRGKRTAISSDEDSPAGKTSHPRKRLRGRLNPISEEEQQDLDDDLRDLASSGSDTEVRPSQRKKKDARQEALARLKRKRTGGVIALSDDDNDDEDDDDQQEDAYHYLDEDEDDTVLSDGEPEEAENTLLPPGRARRDMFNSNEEDDAFVIADEDEDADGPLGVPGNIPIEFTRYASMKAKDLFRYAIDWMVQKKINPAFQIDDEIYHLAFKKLDDEVKGLAGSKFTSSAWTPEFTCTLEARPELEYNKIDRRSSEHFMRDKCDACNRSGHPATYEVHFEGRPYDNTTLEPVARSSSSSDSESDSDSDDEEGEGLVDAKGRAIAPTTKVYYLGKFCMHNAQTAHSLNHWRYHLYEWVVDYLNQAGYNAPSKIVKRDNWSTRKRRKYANKIVDAMQTDGKIKSLYGDFKGEIDTARNSNQGRFRVQSP